MKKLSLSFFELFKKMDGGPMCLPPPKTERVNFQDCSFSKSQSSDTMFSCLQVTRSGYSSQQIYQDQLFYQINIFQNCFTQRNKTPILVLYVWNSNMHMNKFCVGYKYARSRAAEKIITFSYSHLFCLAHIATDFWS